MSLYILCNERQVERIVKNFRRESEEEIHDDGLKERINNDLDLNFNNRATKFNMIKFFGEGISFSYPKDRSVSQIVFKPSVPVSGIIEHNLRDRDVITERAKILLDEISSFKFGLEDSLCLPSDLAISLERFKDARPSKWLNLISKLISGKTLIHGDSWFFKFVLHFSSFQVAYSAKRHQCIVPSLNLSTV